MEANVLNNKKPDSILPLMYSNPRDKGVFWICDYDQDDKITSVFMGHKDRYIAYMPSLEDAENQEELLKNDGWVKCKKPEINVKIDDKKLPRSLRRKLERDDRKQQNKNK